MIKVLVVDDSNFMRTVIKNILERDGEIRVVGTAGNGEEAIEKTNSLRPDIVTLDVIMDGMDGLETLKEIKRKGSARIIMISAADGKIADLVLRCFEAGAFTFISKPMGTISTQMGSIAREIVAQVKLAYRAKLKEPKKFFEVKQPKRKKISKKSRIGVAIGSSLGGIPSIENVLMPICELKCSFFIVQHILPDFVESLAGRLDSILSISVKVAEEGEKPRENVAYIAPGDHHMEIKNGTIALSRGGRVNSVRPSADILMSSVADEYGEKSIGIVLSGMGKDGAAGLKRMHDRGALTMAESERSCVVFGMPKSAIELGGADLVVDASEIGLIIEKRVGEMEDNG